MHVGGEDSDQNGITKSGNSICTKFTTMIQFQMFCTPLVLSKAKRIPVALARINPQALTYALTIYMHLLT
jgi:hypothetical protein